MAPKFQAPQVPFIPARHHGGSQTPKAIVMHATVSSDNKGTARQIATWWNGPTSPMSSAHYTVDPGEVIQSVGDHTVAYHCGFNANSIGVEMCDEQVGPAARWQDADSTAIIRRAANLVAQLCLAYGIEPVRPTIAQLKAKGPHGIYGHNDSRLAFGGTTHSDPRDFPWPMFMRLVRKEVRRLRKAAQTPAPVVGPAKPKPYRVHVMQASMLYSLTLKQKREDLDIVFARAARRDVAWVTGTEYPDDASRAVLSDVAGEYGYRVFFRGRDDVWIAVQRDFIKGNLEVEHEVVIPKEEGFGKKGPRGVLRVSFDSFSDLGRVTVAAAHMLTKGRPDGKGIFKTNVVLNRRFAKAIGDVARKFGKGKGLFFLGSDTNIVDRDNDVFFGQPLTTAWDELDKWENTGHGNIDVTASYDGDGRVSAAYCRALDDGELHLHGDHFLVEAGYDVERRG